MGSVWKAVLKIQIGIYISTVREVDNDILVFFQFSEVAKRGDRGSWVVQRDRSIDRSIDFAVHINVHRTSGSACHGSFWDPISACELIVSASRTVPSGIIGSVVPGRIVGAGGDWSWTGRHALRFRIVKREMYGLGLLDLGCVNYATIWTQWGRWSAAW